jgi:hypothetical protein
VDAPGSRPDFAVVRVERPGVAEAAQVPARVPAVVDPVLDDRVDQDRVGEISFSVSDFEDDGAAVDRERYRDFGPLSVDRRRRQDFREGFFAATSADASAATVSRLELSAGGEVEVEAQLLGAFGRAQLIEELDPARGRGERRPG